MRPIVAIACVVLLGAGTKAYVDVLRWQHQAAPARAVLHDPVAARQQHIEAIVVLQREMLANTATLLEVARRDDDVGARARLVLDRVRDAVR